jgi:hypothetical protein
MGFLLVHSTFAGILVASSKDEEPINKLTDLFKMDQAPLLSEGAMDPKMLKHYVLLHDNQDGSTEKYYCLDNYFIILFYFFVYFYEGANVGNSGVPRM